MKLLELFQSPPLDMGQDMANMLQDILTPLAAQKVPFVTVQQIIDKLRDFRTGITIDRGMLLNLLDPEKVKIIFKIEGDRIYLNLGNESEGDRKNDETEQRDQQRVHQNVVKQAKQAASGDDAAHQAAQNAPKTGEGPL